ncbi:MAG: hypothetical protein WCE80_12610 [Acidimicrobiia bacterium]
MTPDNDQLTVLRRLQSQGRITDDEFRDLAKGFAGDDPGLESTSEEVDMGEMDPTPDVVGDGDSSPERGLEHKVADLEDDEEDPPYLTPSFRESLTVDYLRLVFLASLVLLAVSLFGFISWWVSILTILVLVTTLVDGWEKVTRVGAAVTAVVMVAALLFPSAAPEQPEQAVTVTLPPQDPHPPIAGSLGIYMDQVIDLWNTVDGSPRINKGLTRHNEVGEYDTFIYRFGDWGRLAGAYDPGNEAVYALLITGTFSAPDTPQLYLHLCYMIAPYSQECIDSYHEKGLHGGVLSDFADTAHEAEWTVDDSTWRLVIDQNVMTVRVYGPDAA